MKNIGKLIGVNKGTRVTWKYFCILIKIRKDPAVVAGGRALAS